MKPYSPHWADQTAARIIGVWGDRDDYVVASGITPSGTVHIGNFREVITVDLVARALRSLGKRVRFVYSWDDFDTFRKVPKNLPNQEMLQKYLRQPISRVPDPYGQEDSYALANIRRFERDLETIGIFPEYLYQHQRYGDHIYAEQIRHALENKGRIKAILDEHRTSPLDEAWLPSAIYCETCNRDEMEYERYPGGWNYEYRCVHCRQDVVTDIRTTSNLKLNWRTDWPMRWAFEKVDFEPGGKDHSSQGGSYDTGKMIVKQIWDRDPPQYLQYDFVMLKGVSGKMSSSSGALISLGEAFEVYDPQIIRWIFACQRPNHDFSLSFDADVIKTYDEFDRAERAALGPKPDKLGKWPVLRRTYELSCVGQIPSEAPYRPPFRDLCSRLQICDGDIERTRERFYADCLKNSNDTSLFDARASCALQWLKKHAGEEFRYQINKEPSKLQVSADDQSALDALKALIDSTDLETIDPKDLNQMIYDEVIRGVGVEPKAFFKTVYQRLIGRDQGPRLPSFLKEIGAGRLRQLL